VLLLYSKVRRPLCSYLSPPDKYIASEDEMDKKVPVAAHARRATTAVTGRFGPKPNLPSSHHDRGTGMLRRLSLSNTMPKVNWLITHILVYSYRQCYTRSSQRILHPTFQTLLPTAQPVHQSIKGPLFHLLPLQLTNRNALRHSAPMWADQGVHRRLWVNGF
jgi:hypothetical protein